MTEISASQFSITAAKVNEMLGSNPASHTDLECVYAGVVPDVAIRGRRANVDFVVRAGLCAVDLAVDAPYRRWLVDVMPDAARVRGIPGAGDFGAGLSLDLAETAGLLLPEHRLVVASPAGDIRLSHPFVNMLSLPVLRVMCLEESEAHGATLVAAETQRPELRLLPMGE